MSTALKDRFYSPAFFQQLSRQLKTVYPVFPTQKFKLLIFDENWENKALKQRTRHTTQILRQLLPPDYTTTLTLLKELSSLAKKQLQPKQDTYAYTFLPDFVAHYGLNDYDLSIPALAHFTTLISAEFAVRPFLIQYPKKMLTQMLTWSRHENHHVRRLASEGCRPRLPWGMALTTFKKDPAPILPILEQLKNDDFLYVRRSVANNLNDVAKDHPDLVLKIAQKWKGSNPNTDWVVKHACRTLLKKGNPKALQLFGWQVPKNVTIQQLTIVPNQLNIGDAAYFSFTLINNNNSPQDLRLEYRIAFVKAKGQTAPKIFKIAEKTIAPNTTISFKKKQSFKNLTTRTHYTGTHQLSIIVNGQSLATIAFELTRN